MLRGVKEHEKQSLQPGIALACSLPRLCFTKGCSSWRRQYLRRALSLAQLPPFNQIPLQFRSRETVLTLQCLVQEGRALGVLPVTSSGNAPSTSSICTLLAARLFLFHLHQDQNKGFSAYLLLFPYVSQTAPPNSIFVSASTTFTV